MDDDEIDQKAADAYQEFLDAERQDEVDALVARLSGERDRYKAVVELYEQRLQAISAMPYRMVAEYAGRLLSDGRALTGQEGGE